jgi:hypothetical protein
VFADDAQVVVLSCPKRYGDVACVMVTAQGKEKSEILPTIEEMRAILDREELEAL